MDTEGEKERKRKEDLKVVKERIEKIIDTISSKNPRYNIILYNDDVNTFDFVINSLVNVCDHTLQQAEQCTMLVHYKGECVVKTGMHKELVPKCSMLVELGLDAEVKIGSS